MENIIKAEIFEGNYIKVSQKATIVSAYGAVSKTDSSELKLIHDCSKPHEFGVDSFCIKKQSFQTTDDVTLTTPTF